LLAALTYAAREEEEESLPTKRARWGMVLFQRSVARPRKTLGLPFPRSIFFSFASAYDELSEECDLRPAGSRIQSHFCTGTWMHLLLLLMN
jgi:hypothetical protein